MGIAGVALAASILQAGAARHAYASWSKFIKSGECSENSDPVQLSVDSPSNGSGVIECATLGGIRAYRFPAGVFEIDEQLLVPERVSITGVASPNDMSEPTRSPNWGEQTVFLATRGVTDYHMNYCHATDMVKTRVGFVLSSHVAVRNLSYQGVDTIRPSDNGALCGGGAFETKGCAENDCSVSDVNNGGSDGNGSTNVVIENVRLNDFYYSEDKGLIGAEVKGNYNCSTEDWDDQCCFCKPNGVRSTQIGVWVPQARNTEGSSDILVKDVVSRSTQGDGINLHGYVHGALVTDTYFENTGDDVYALWGAALNPSNVTFRNAVAVNPGVLRPNWYGVCVATYGLDSALFENVTCRMPTLEHPIPSPHDGALTIDTSMFVFYGDFSAAYPSNNKLAIRCFTFEDLNGKAYTPDHGTRDEPTVGKMVWTEPNKQKGHVLAPYYLNSREQSVNVHVDICTKMRALRDNAGQNRNSLDGTLDKKISV